MSAPRVGFAELGVEAERRQGGSARAHRREEGDHAEARAEEELGDELGAEDHRAMRLREERRGQRLVPELARDGEGAEEHREHVADG